MATKNNAEQQPKYLPSPLNTAMINYKAYYMSIGEKIFYSLIIFVIGGLVGLVFYGGLFKYEGEATVTTYISNFIVFVLIGGIALKFFLPEIRSSLMEKRYKRLRKQFMDMLECLSVSLSAGNTVNDSFISARKDMQNQYTENDYIMLELNEIVQGLDNGLTLEEMILSFGNRSNNEDIENFGNVISNCYRLGGDFRDVVRKTRNIISDKIAVADEIDTKLSSNTMQLNVMCLMPIALVAMLKVTNATFAENLASLLGVVVTTIAIGIIVAAYLWGRKIVNIG